MTHKIDNKMLLRAINKWEETAPLALLLDHRAVRKHILEEYGIQIGIGYTTVVDEGKYLMFLLKWSSCDRNRNKTE